MSARSASEPAPAELASCRVRVPGTARTYEVRDQLRGLGLRWDPATHAWHGTIRAGDEVVLQRELHVRAQIVHPIEAFATDTSRAPPAGPKPAEPRPRAAGEPRGPLRDGSRTHAEARRVYREEDSDDPEREFHPRFTVWDVTSGLPDDSREADECAADRRLHNLRGRVKAARAALSGHPEAQKAVRADLRREAAFYARFEISQAQFRNGVAFPEWADSDKPATDAHVGQGGEAPRARDRAVLEDGP